MLYPGITKCETRRKRNSIARDRRQGQSSSHLQKLSTKWHRLSLSCSSSQLIYSSQQLRLQYSIPSIHKILYNNSLLHFLISIVRNANVVHRSHCSHRPRRILRLSSSPPTPSINLRLQHRHLPTHSLPPLRPSLHRSNVHKPHVRQQLRLHRPSPLPTRV